MIAALSLLGLALAYIAFGLTGAIWFAAGFASFVALDAWENRR